MISGYQRRARIELIEERTESFYFNWITIIQKLIDEGPAGVYSGPGLFLLRLNAAFCAGGRASSGRQRKQFRCMASTIITYRLGEATRHELRQII